MIADISIGRKGVGEVAHKTFKDKPVSEILFDHEERVERLERRNLLAMVLAYVVSSLATRAIILLSSGAKREEVEK